MHACMMLAKYPLNKIVVFMHAIFRINPDENRFVAFEIDEQGDENGINTLWDIATEFMNDNLDITEKINILLILNDEINPIDGIVYEGRDILVHHLKLIKYLFFQKYLDCHS